MTFYVKNKTTLKTKFLSRQPVEVLLERVIALVLDWSRQGSAG